jgi:hypothetical protein
LRQKVALELSKDALNDVMRGLEPILTASQSLEESFAVMYEIDSVFGHIHPRSVVASPAYGVNSRRTIPEWLKVLKSQRRENGHYGGSAEWLVLPRGPLTRRERDPNASSADSVADRFAYLTVVPSTVLENGRKVPVRVCTIEADTARGTSPARSPGSEMVGFVPIAEEAGDVVHAIRTTDGRHFVDFRARTDLDSAKRFISAIERSKPVDIAVAPELVMAQDRAAQLPDLILRSRLTVSERPGLFVAGSGATSDKEKGQPWNEGTILNSIGTVLWTQRKVQQAGISSDRARQFPLPEPGIGRQIMEDNASGDEIVIADVSGFGRCVVLICQDLQARPLSEEIVSSN